MAMISRVGGQQVGLQGGGQWPQDNASLVLIRQIETKVTGTIVRQIEHFDAIRRRSLQAYTEASQEAASNPTPLCERYNVQNIGELLKILKQIYVGPVDLAFETANQELKLIEKSIDLFVKCAEACTSVVLGQLEAQVKMRMGELSVIEREIDIDNKQKQFELSQQAERLKLQTEAEMHALTVIERRHKMKIEEKKTDSEIALEEQKIELEAEVARKKLFLEEHQLDNEHREKVTKLVHEKEIKLQEIEGNLKIERGRQKTELAKAEIQAAAETNRTTIQAISKIFSPL